MQKKIYIADIRSNSSNGKSTGHYVPVAKMYQKIFRNTIVAGGPIYKKYFSDNELYLLPYNISATSFNDRIKLMKNCIKLFNAAKDQIIILQQSSVVTTFLGILLFYHCKSKLYLIQYSNECFKSKIGRMLYKMIKHKINGIICPTKELGKKFGVPSCIVPDYIYIEDSNISETYKDYDKTIYDFCILGRIAPEKGVVECAKKFVNTKYKIIIAGKPQTKELENNLKDICGNATNIKLVLDYISEKDYSNILVNSKYALLNYQKEYSDRSSGVVFDMLFNKVPVIGSTCKTLQFIQDKQLGYIYNDIKEFNPEIVMDKNLYNSYINNISSYRKEHQKYISSLITFIK